MKNELVKILDRYEHVSLNYYNVSRNPNIYFDYIIKHLEKNWVWRNVCENVEIKIEDILINHHLSWNWTGLSLNKNIKMENIILNLRDNPIDYQTKLNLHRHNILLSFLNPRDEVF